MSSFGLFMIGALFVVGGSAYSAFVLDIGPVWIGVSAFIIGIGIMNGVVRTCRREPQRVIQRFSKELS